MRMIIDRFEGIYAVCEKEDCTMVNIPKNELPNEAKEGDILVEKGSGIFEVDKEATKIRREEIEALLNN